MNSKFEITYSRDRRRHLYLNLYRNTSYRHFVRSHFVEYFFHLRFFFFFHFIYAQPDTVYILSEYGKPRALLKSLF